MVTGDFHSPLAHPMSEFQYYEFVAIDRPLSVNERKRLRAITSRATITSTRLVNTYEWGNFKGDPHELAALSATPRRTIRYYIQLGLVDRPIGKTRAAYYDWRHLRQLLEIRRLTEEGFSLERIGERLRANTSASESPVRTSTPGTIQVLSHVHLAPGLELVIDPAAAQLSSEKLRALIREIVAIKEHLVVRKVYG
jgi:DNA-binding transcriptional MerR regulator